MARYNVNRIPYSVQERLINVLCDTLFHLKTKTGVRNFLKDLLNRQERAMLVRRLLIAERLLQEKTYREIRDELHTGLTTIARVDRWLHFGRGGYKNAIARLKSLKNK